MVRIWSKDCCRPGMDIIAIIRACSLLVCCQVQQEADKARRMAQRKDYYAILGIGQDAPPHEVKQAYRKGAQLYHPDKAAAAGLTKEEAEGKFTDLAEAYEVRWLQRMW